MTKKLLFPILLLLCTVANAGDGGRRVVIIGDSITDGNWGCIYNYKRTSAERSSTDMNHIYGHSYVLFIATHYQSRKPEREYQFFNRGFSGNKLRDLAARWQEDVLDLHPDVRLVLCTPFIAKQGGLAESPEYPLREQMTESLAAAVRELCKEFGAVCIPFDTMFRELIEKQPRPSFWIWDGIHPTPVGHRRMAELWIRKVGRL